MALTQDMAQPVNSFERLKPLAECLVNIKFAHKVSRAPLRAERVSRLVTLAVGSVMTEPDDANDEAIRRFCEAIADITCIDICRDGCEGRTILADDAQEWLVQYGSERQWRVSPTLIPDLAVSS